MNTEAENKALRDIIIDKELYIQELKATILDYEDFVGRMKEEECNNLDDGQPKRGYIAPILKSGWIPWDASSGQEKPPELSWYDRVSVLMGQGDDFISPVVEYDRQVKELFWRKEDYHHHLTDDIFFYQKSKGEQI